MSIESLRNRIYSQLSNLVREDYVLLDIPNHRNIGDQLIYKGELDFLEKCHYKCIMQASAPFFFKEKIDTRLILMHGGGNFGDIYTELQDFKERIVDSNRDKRIVFFPNSVQFHSEKKLKKSAEIFSKHPDITICARDNFSFRILKENFVNCTVLLVPDMAFCSDYKVKKEANKELLILQRTDLESNNDNMDTKDLEVDIADWPTYHNTSNELFNQYYFFFNKYLSKVVLSVLNNNSRFGVLPLRKQDDYISNGIDFISNYKFVISNRLHGHILALLLGIPSILVDNSYGKNSRFHQTWLQEFNNSYFANTFNEAIELYNKINKS